MKNQIRTFVTSLGLTAMLGASFLYSQSMPAETATVPFAFHVQRQDFSAGRYRLSGVNNAGVVMIRNLDTGNSAIFTVNPATVVKSAKLDDPKLIFNRYGDHYFLSQVWTPNAARIDVTPSAREKEIAKSAAPLAMAVIHADR